MGNFTKHFVFILTYFVFGVSNAFSTEEEIMKMYPPGVTYPPEQILHDLHLKQAVEELNLDKIVLALELGGNPNIRNNNDRDPADSSQHEGMLEYFLHNIYHPSLKDHSYVRRRSNFPGEDIPVEKALRVIEKFIHHGAHLFIPSPMNTYFQGCSLYYAILLNNIEVIKLLVTSGANPDNFRGSKNDSILLKDSWYLRDEIGLSLLDYAKYKQFRVKIFKELLHLGARNTLKRPGSAISGYIDNLNQINWTNREGSFNSCTEEFKQKALALCFCLKKLSHYSLHKDLRILISKYLGRILANENLQLECYSDENIQNEIIIDKEELLDKNL